MRSVLDECLVKVEVSGPLSEDDMVGLFYVYIYIFYFTLKKTSKIVISIEQNYYLYLKYLNILLYLVSYKVIFPRLENLKYFLLFQT